MSKIKSSLPEDFSVLTGDELDPDEPVSQCCEAPLLGETDFCSACMEHTGLTN